MTSMITLHRRRYDAILAPQPAEFTCQERRLHKTLIQRHDNMPTVEHLLNRLFFFSTMCISLEAPQFSYFKIFNSHYMHFEAGPLAQSVGHLTRKSGVLGSIPGRATYFRFSFRFFKKGSCQLLAKVCARSTG